MTRALIHEFHAIAREALGDEAADVRVMGVEPTPAGPRVRYEGVPTARYRGRRELLTDRALTWEATSRYLATRWRAGPMPAPVPEDSWRQLMELFPEVYGEPVETGPGWHWLLTLMAEWMGEVGIPPEFQTIQVKEKYGSLRVYFAPHHDPAYPYEAVIAAVERLSEGVCETCGAPGQARKTGWVRVRCDDHAGR
ncbi:hypothetical protein [Methylobacterium sp. 37f]|uniref:hypothetical protein n=1 Tax=Methylobacterium sp. 37f TaxID=2817058 RepID=UPI001FFD6682|nr:hypothetical protein [Methylobacterium sp. 37f]MCK2055286.1 hypothetical protein [Methylobacterium sp. 37f]